MSNIQVKFDKEKGSADIYGQSMIFHCNHYNRFLQQTIEDASYLDLDRILVKAAAEVTYQQLSEYFRCNQGLSLQEKLDFAAALYSFCGFGLLKFSDFNRNGGIAVEKISHYGMAVKLNFGNRTKPAEYFDRGFVLGVAGALQGSLSGPLFSDTVGVTQNGSISLGDDFCKFEVRMNDTLVPNDLPEFMPVPAVKFQTTVDEDAIVSAVSGMPLTGDEEGLIPAFGVYLTRMYADYYNKISFRFESEIKKALGSTDIAKELLIEAGHVCAFNTFGGIMKSEEWKALIKPMLSNTEDWLHGVIAVVNALGWGIWRVEELAPGEKLVVRAYQDYESLGYLKWFGKAEHPVSYLLTGGCAGLMNLLYLGKIEEEPELSKEFYYTLFKDQSGFKGKQTKCLAMGDAYSEIVVTR